MELQSTGCAASAHATPPWSWRKIIAESFTDRNVLPGDIVIDREWRGQFIHCLGCRARLGVKYIQVPREKVGELYQSGRFVLKMEKVCFNDGSHILENADAEVPVQDYCCRLDKVSNTSLSISVIRVSLVFMCQEGQEHCFTWFVLKILYLWLLF